MTSSDADRIRSGLTPDQYAGLVEATEGLKREPGHLVVLATQRQFVPPETVQRFAEGLGLDAYSARQRLIAPFPRILRREEHRSEAQRWVEWLREAGVAAFMVSERRVLEFGPREATTLVCEGGRVEFGSEGVPTDRIDGAGVLCIALGKLRTRVVRQSTPDLLGLGHPGRHEVAAAGVDNVADVHLAADERVFRIRESTLKVAPGRPGVPRFRGALDALKAACPGAVVVDGFGPAAEALAESRRLVGRADQLEYRPGGTAVPRVGAARVSSFEDSDGAAFDLYSLLSALQLSRA